MCDVLKGREQAGWVSRGSVARLDSWVEVSSWKLRVTV